MADLTLSPHLAERTRVLSPGTPDGEFVLYWMHHAARGHENPALDTAVAAGNALGLPVLVYQGLSCRLPYASDRHHTFMLEGFRDAQRELESRGVAHALRVTLRREDREPLAALAARAALVVAEDYPAPPYPRWTGHLARSIDAPVWVVDASCVVPLRSVGGPFERAYEFRRRIARELERRVEMPWRDLEPEVPPFEGDPGFRSIDLAGADLAEICGRCEIDHSVARVPHTRGGSVAGYRRWETFRDRGLEAYARRRNDPVRDGVSRMSPYLHHGQVSPLRIAREAAMARGAGGRQNGPEKFLDELVVWRELAFNFCHHQEDPGSLDALPEWARETLDRHAGDPREELFSWETLARGETGDPLWDACQKSLLIHGELHNNLRMTWGKAFLGWTPSPQEALRLALDLNHRYALDGSDPNSYGGILWCLGLFDRPYRPERPVTGSIRPRVTDAHRKRFDFERYRARVTLPARRDRLSVAVVGAGVSGLAAARLLRDHGLTVRVFEKARGGGGRMATRREGSYRFDHGAQYFTARDPRFKRHVESWVEDGVAAPWQGRIVALEGGAVEPVREAVDRYVGVPGMSAVGRHLAAGLEPSFSTRVAGIERAGRQWRLRASSGSPLGTFDAAIVTAPPAQAAPLLAEAPELARRARSVELRPCWAVMIVWREPLPLAFDGAFVSSSPLSWIARNSSKPGRPEADSWILHASPDWSARHVDTPADEVSAHLLEGFLEATGLQEAGAPPAEPVFLRAHRWRYSIAREPLEGGCLWAPELHLGACGDWCHGSRVEGAFLSGTAIAGRVLGTSDVAAEPENLTLPGLATTAPALAVAAG